MRNACDDLFCLLPIGMSKKHVVYGGPVGAAYHYIFLNLIDPSLRKASILPVEFLNRLTPFNARIFAYPREIAMVSFPGFRHLNTFFYWPVMWIICISTSELKDTRPIFFSSPTHSAGLISAPYNGYMLAK